MSLDVFRGATIASMILVNNPGSDDHIYPPLEHAAWHGWTFTDLVFPFFLWIVGVAMTLSFAKRVEAGADRGKLFLHSLRRSAVIFFIGFAMAFTSRFSLATVRIPGVLQRIAVCYLIAAAIYLLGGIRWCAISAGVLLVAYWLLMAFAPVPGAGPGVLEPNRNFADWIDGQVLAGHMWSVTKTRDPEGLVSTLPAIATTLFGILAGELLRRRRSILCMASIAAALIAAGQIMNVWLPINKNLWTSSFSVFMAGMALAVFTTCYWLVDVKGHKRWTKPFAIYGMNAITVYVLSGVLARFLGRTMVLTGAGKRISLQEWTYEGLAHWLSPLNASLAFAIANVLVLYAVAWVMYRRKWFVRF